MATVNKNGFTLVEVLAVIVLIGALMLIVVPNVTSIFEGSVNKAMQVQENEIEDAALAYLEDYCKNPIGRNRCTLTRNTDYTYSGSINLSTLISNEYIDTVKARDALCIGYVTITNNKARAYITCGDVYTTTGYSN